MLTRRQFAAGTTALAMSSGAGTRARADTWPSKPIRWIVPFAAGGATDIVGRLLSEKLTPALGARFVVENRGGAGGLTGTRVAVQSPPDGYTVVGMSFNYLVYPTLFKDLDFDIVADLTPLSLIAVVPTVLVVNPSSPYKTVKDVVEAAQKSPGALQFATSGVGTAAHIAGELLNRVANIKMAAVAYRGGSPANADVIAGHIPMHFSALGSTMEFIRSGQLRAIGVAMPKRIRSLPDVPTMVESGYPEFVINELQGVLMPRGTPAEIVERLNKEIRTALQDQELKRRFETMGFEMLGSTPKEFADFIKTDSAKWIEVARAAGIKPQ